MNIIGTVTLDHIEKMENIGLTPKQIVDALIAEAIRRNPTDTSFNFIPTGNSGFDIALIRPE